MQVIQAEGLTLANAGIGIIIRINDAYEGRVIQSICQRD